MSEMEIDLITYIHISGPGVDAFNNRKETGGKRGITDREIRASYERIKPKLFSGLEQLLAAAPTQVGAA